MLRTADALPVPRVTYDPALGDIADLAVVNASAVGALWSRQGLGPTEIRARTIHVSAEESRDEYGKPNPGEVSRYGSITLHLGSVASALAVDSVTGPNRDSVEASRALLHLLSHSRDMGIKSYPSVEREAGVAFKSAHPLLFRSRWLTKVISHVGILPAFCFIPEKAPVGPIATVAFWTFAAGMLLMPLLSRGAKRYLRQKIHDPTAPWERRAQRFAAEAIEEMGGDVALLPMRVQFKANDSSVSPAVVPRRPKWVVRHYNAAP
jgi:hypothetical protein